MYKKITLFKLFFTQYRSKLEFQWASILFSHLKKLHIKDRSIHRNLSFQSTKTFFHYLCTTKLQIRERKKENKRFPKKRSIGHCGSFSSRFKCYRILNCLDEIILLLENVKSFDFNTTAISLLSSFLHNSDSIFNFVS